MKSFEKIIGYESIKKQLMRVADVLKNPTHYNKLGAKPPKGLLLDGRPGMGKSLMANALIEASGRNAFVCRKDKPNGSFVDFIKETFEKAKENSPSIVFLDDMDKFANEDEAHCNAEEYVTIQSCIDSVKDYDVFVLATTNGTNHLPESLLRAGRFDIIIDILRPKYNDAIKIIKHYLKGKDIMSDVDAGYIAKLMNRESCAALESVINQAANIAGFERSEKIQLSHFVEAASGMVFNRKGFGLCNDEIDLTNFDSCLAEVVYHEAGHCLVNEILNPESVTLVAIGSNCGYTSCFDGVFDDNARQMELSLITDFAGIAAVEQVFGRKGVGCECDLVDARWTINRLMRSYGKYGMAFTYHGSRNDSQSSVHNQEVAADPIMEMYYEKAKRIIAANRQFLEKLANELAEKRLLTTYDIQRIKSNCIIKAVDMLW